MKDGCRPVQVLDSLGGRSSLVRDVTMETGLSEVVLLIVLAIWPMRSSTQPADSRASASWSQHSSMVSHIWLRPCSNEPEHSQAVVQFSFFNKQGGLFVHKFQI